MKGSPISSSDSQWAARVSLLLGACLCALLIAAIARPAHAADPRADARADLVAGMNLLDTGDSEGALGKFRAAFALVPSPKIQFNMGLALQRLGRNVEALESFDRFLDGASDVPQEKRDQAERHRLELLSKVSSVTITSRDAGVDIAIDGVTRGKTPLAHPLYVDPGSHQLAARADGKPAARQTFASTSGAELTIPIVMDVAEKPPATPPRVASPGASAHLDLSAKAVRGAASALAPAHAAPASPLMTHAPSAAADDVAIGSSNAGWTRPVEWISLGLGVAAIGVGLWETRTAVNRAAEFNAIPDDCMDDGNGHIRGGTRCEQITRDQTVATWAAAIGYGVGGTLVATALVLHRTKRDATTPSSESPAPSDTAPRSRRVRQRIALALGAAGAGGLVTGITYLFIQNRGVAEFNARGCKNGLENDGPATGFPAADCKTLHANDMSAERVSVASFASALVLGGLGTYFFFSRPNETASSPESTAAERSRSISLRCLPWNDHGIRCGGRF